MKGIEKALEVVHKLRSPDGCPWDKVQTHQSLRPYLLEESHEVLEVLDSIETKKDFSSLKDELGDLLLQILLHSELAQEKGEFSFDDVAQNLAEKLERRHPHVFAGSKAKDSQEVESNWAAMKAKEKKRDSALDGVSPALPALAKAQKVIERVSKVGFQWDSLEGPLEKMREELLEFEQEIRLLGLDPKELKKLDATKKSALESELGDLFFTLVNLAYFLQIPAEDALRGMLGRFEERFRLVEKLAQRDGKELSKMSLAEMDILWDEAKKALRKI